MRKQVGYETIRAGAEVWHTGRGKQPRSEFLKQELRPVGLKDTTSHKGLVVYRSCEQNTICQPEDVKVVQTIVIDPHLGFAS